MVNISYHKGGSITFLHASLFYAKIWFFLPTMKRTEPYKPLCFLVPVLADEVWRVYDDPEAFLIQQKHHFPLKTEKGTSSVKEYSQNTFPAQTQQVRELSHHPDCKIYSLRFFHTFSTSAQVTGGKPPSETLGVLDDWNEPLLHSAHVASPGTENPSRPSLWPLIIYFASPSLWGTRATCSLSVSRVWSLPCAALWLPSVKTKQKTATEQTRNSREHCVQVSTGSWDWFQHLSVWMCAAGWNKYTSHCGLQFKFERCFIFERLIFFFYRQGFIGAPATAEGHENK